MVTAKPLGQLNKAGRVASFVTLARHNSKSGGTQSPPIFLLIYIYFSKPEVEAKLYKADRRQSLVGDILLQA